MSEKKPAQGTEWINDLLEANLGYKVSLDRNMNIHEMRRRVENILWTRREDIVQALTGTQKLIEDYEKKIADLNQMLDAMSPAKPEKKKGD